MAECDGMCLDSADIGVPGYGIAYPHPGCPLHAPGEVCGCGQPRRCNSYTHNVVWRAEHGYLVEGGDDAA